MNFRRHVQTRYAPLVEVVAHPDVAAALAEREGLTPAALFRPAGEEGVALNVPIRTVGEQSYRLRDLSLRFVDAGDARPPSLEDVDAAAAAAVEAAAAAAGVGPAGRPRDPAAAALRAPPDPLAALRAGDPLASLPWFDAYAEVITRLSGWAGPGFGGGCDVPCARVCVAPAATGPAVVEVLRALAATPPPPGPAAAGAATAGAPEVLHFLLLDDRAAGGGGEEAAAAAAAALAAATAALGGAGRVSMLTLHAPPPTGDASPPPSPPPPSASTNPWAGALARTPGLAGGGAGEGGAEPPPAPRAGRGAGLSPADAAAVRGWVAGWAARALVPGLEARIRALHSLAAAGRKGLRSQLMKAFMFNRKAPPGGGGGGGGGGSGVGGGGGAGGGGGRSGAVTPQPGGEPASSSTPPSDPADAAALARLADLALALRDWETAAWAARAAAADAKGARDGPGAADAAEVLGLALGAAAGARPAPGAPPPTPAARAAAMDPALTALRDAVARRTALAGPGGGAAPDGTGGVSTPAAAAAARAGASRAAVLLAAAAAAVGRWSDGHWGLMKAHFGEAPLPAALLLEQAALCLLRLGGPGTDGGGGGGGATPAPPPPPGAAGPAKPAVRKWAFHTVLAGLRYAAGGATGLGAAAYGAAFPIYAGSGWPHVEEHVRDVLGRAAAGAGDAAGAAAAFGGLLPAAHAPPAWQAHYLSQWAAAAAAAADSAAAAAAAAGDPPPPPPPAPVPTVAVDRVVLHAEGGETYGGPDARAAPAAAWRRLDWALGGGAVGGGGASATTPAAAATPAGRLCVAGEAVTADVPLANPMAVPLALEGLCLVVSHVEGGSGPGGAHPPPEVTVAARDVTLAPGEAAVLRLAATPAGPGSFALTGVEWRLAGVAARADFVAPPAGRRGGRGGARGGGGGAAAAAAAWAVFTAVPPLPRLAADVVGLPPSLLAGELAPVTLVLTNVGPAPAGRISLAVGCADALVAGGVAWGSAPGARPPPVPLPLTPRPLPRPPGVAPDDVAAAAAAADAAACAGLAAFDAPAGGVLAPGQAAAWRVWVHPPAGRGGPGALDVRLVVAYGPADGGKASSRRLLRARAVADVAPGVRARGAPAALTAGPGGGADAGLAGAARRWAVRLDAAADARLPPPGASLDRLAVWGRGWRLATPGGGGGDGDTAVGLATRLPPGGCASLFLSARAPPPPGASSPSGGGAEAAALRAAPSTPDLSGALQRALSLDGEGGEAGEGGGAEGPRAEGPPARRPARPVDADTDNPATAATAAAAAAAASPADGDAALAAFHARRRAAAAAGRAGRAAAAAAAAAATAGPGKNGRKPPPPALPPPPPPPSAVLEWSAPPGPGAGPAAPRRRGACHLLAAGPPLFGGSGGGGPAAAPDAAPSQAPLCSAVAALQPRSPGGGPPRAAVTVVAVNRTGGPARLRVRAGRRPVSGGGGAGRGGGGRGGGGGWQWTPPAPPAGAPASPAPPAPSPIPLGPPPAPSHAWVGATAAATREAVPPGGEGVVRGLALALLDGGDGPARGGLDLGPELEVAWVPVGGGAAVLCAPPRLQLVL